MHCEMTIYWETNLFQSICLFEKLETYCYYNLNRELEMYYSTESQADDKENVVWIIYHINYSYMMWIRDWCT